MTRQEAKQILLLYRPETADAEDPDFAEALALAKQDAELTLWFEQHCGVQRILRARFQGITPPEALKEQIIAEHHARLVRERLRRPVTLVAVAAMCVLMALALALLLRPRSERTVAGFRQRMISTTRPGTYPPMLIETNDVREIRACLAQNQGPADFVLPRALEAATSTGGAVLRWQSQPVSMICFRTGRPLKPGEKSDLFLFVIDRSAMTDAPGAGSPRFTTTNQITAASWVEGDKFYLLTCAGDETILQRFL